MDLFDAIYKRKSVRKYQPEGVSGAKLFEIWELIESVERLYPDIKMEIQMVEQGIMIQEISSGIIGSYGQVLAPHYLVVTSEEKEGHLENVGYAIENLVLGMTSLGVGTCWIGGQVKKELLKDIVQIAEGQKPVMIIAFGMGENPEKQFREPADQVKRKALSDLIIEGEPGEVWTNIMEAVRLAPSAVNSQPWRFAFTDEGVHVYGIKRRNPLTKWIFSQLNFVDVGIALSHLQIAAEHYGKKIEFKKMPDGKRRGYNYVMSVVEV